MQPLVLGKWDDTIWTVMVEKGIVHRNGRITFVNARGATLFQAYGKSLTAPQSPSMMEGL